MAFNHPECFVRRLNSFYTPDESRSYYGMARVVRPSVTKHMLSAGVTTCRINFQFHRYYASGAPISLYWSWALQLIKYAHTDPITEFRILVIPEAIF